MKQQWKTDELIDQWTLTHEEVTLVRNISQIDYNRLGYGLLLKYFQLEGKFPLRKQDIPRLMAQYQRCCYQPPCKLIIRSIRHLLQE